MAPALFALLNPLRAFLSPRVAQKRNVQVKLALIDQGVDMLIENLVVEGLDAHEALTDFARANGLARLSLDDGYGPVAHWEPEPVTVTLGWRTRRLSALCVRPGTDDGEAALIAAVTEILGDAKRVADLFCGLGTFTFAVGENRKVYAAEGELKALLALKNAAGFSGRTYLPNIAICFAAPYPAGTQPF